MKWRAGFSPRGASAPLPDSRYSRKMSGWNPNQYLKFAAERTQPCRDLAARIEVATPRRVIDLGCGPGNSTAVLTDRWPDAEFTGLDSSAEMIERARREYPRQHWIAGDIDRKSTRLNSSHFPYAPLSRPRCYRAGGGVPNSRGGIVRPR